jgi:hypothetical protein
VDDLRFRYGFVKPADWEACRRIEEENGTGITQIDAED